MSAHAASTALKVAAELALTTTSSAVSHTDVLTSAGLADLLLAVVGQQQLVASQG